MLLRNYIQTAYREEPQTFTGSNLYPILLLLTQPKHKSQCTVSTPSKMGLGRESCAL